MSCFTVCDEHIRVLVHAAAHPEHLDIAPTSLREAQGNKVRYYTPDGQFHEVDDSNAAKFGQMLRDANLRAVFDRYDEEEEYPYEHSLPRHTKWSPFEIISAAQCYRYQACDAVDWTGSEAERFISDLIERMVSLTPQMQETNLWEIGENTAPQAVEVATW